MDSGVVQIQILGTTFTVKSDQDPEYVESIIQYIKTKIEEIKQSTTSNDPLRTAILANILITDELFKERNKKGDLFNESDASREASRLTADIIRRLEQSLQE